MKYGIALTIWSFGYLLFAQNENKSLALPKTDSTDWIIHHTGFSLNYDIDKKQARWVAYDLTPAKLVKVSERSDRFLPDPYVNRLSVTNTDYSGSGFDRGHLAPAADMCWSDQAMQESFYFSNICPQEPGFNRGIWKQLENLVRNWTLANKQIYVVTGPIFSRDSLLTIGINQLTVPDYFYKVILQFSGQDYRAIGFIIPNQKSDGRLPDYSLSVDSVESITGLDFFYQLPDSIEWIIENNFDQMSWKWDIKRKSQNSQKEPSGAMVIQCFAITHAGERCKNKSFKSTGYCHIHTKN